MDTDGLTYKTCHSIQKLQSTAGNGGFIMGVPAALVDEKGQAHSRGSILCGHHGTSGQALQGGDAGHLSQAGFCAACHKANLPNPLNGYKFIPAFSAYDDWQNSKFSQRNPLTFYQAEFTTCQGSHEACAQCSA